MRTAVHLSAIYVLQPPDVSTSGAGGSSSEQIWKVLRGWPPDATSRGPWAKSVPGLIYGGGGFQSIKDNGHMGTPSLWQ